MVAARKLNADSFHKDMVAKWRASGLSQAEFCRRHRLEEANLSRWKRREDFLNDLDAVRAKEKAAAERKAKRHRAKEKYWRGLVDEHARSGLSLSAFCKLRGVKFNTMKRWRRELLGIEELVFSSTSARQKNPFVRLAVAQSAVSIQNADGQVEIVLPGNCKIVVTEQTSFSLIAKLLQALKEAPC